MPSSQSQSLPVRPDLEQLRKQAKDLRRSCQQASGEARQRILDLHPTYVGKSPEDTAGASLSDAQLVIAREHGFTSWPRLKEHVDALNVVDREAEALQRAFDAGDEAARERVREARTPEFSKNRFETPFACPLSLSPGTFDLNSRAIRSSPEIGRQLLATGARAVFATSTPVHPDRPFRQEQWSWRNDEIDAYNQTARQIMAELGIPTNDLHAIVATEPDNLLSEDQLHLSEAGKAACAQAVVEAVRDALGSARS